MTLHTAIRVLLALVLGLALVQAVLLWVGALLSSLGDPAGAGVVRSVNTAAGVLWLLSFVGLVVALAVDAARDRPA
ncbi:MAG TPA: hypothetical protein VEQ85_14090 [Lacipirellulaceae bacterium]|nr:hypothetical protein [Lacipirellulaceae bacterium]